MNLLSAILGRLVRQGHLTLIAADGTRHELGEPDKQGPEIRLRDRATERAILLNPQLALGEAYMNGSIVVTRGTIADVLDVLLRNIGMGFGGGHWEWINTARTLVRSWMQRNSPVRSRRNVAHHYDLSGALYDLFLDSDKQYSCAFFQTPEDSLETAQHNKCRRIAAKLDLKPGQRVLDIGSGWGGLALCLAQTADVDVTGITLSEEQLKIANNRAEALGLSDRVRFRLQDYRETAGTFDRIVSVGMFEHVGVVNYGEYFRGIAKLLTDDGVALAHSIGRSDGPGVTNPWIAKYIFPGGYTPALCEVLPVVEKSGFFTTDVEILRLHYAHTLSAWRRRFVANWDRAARLYDERFCRMWEFYLAASEMAFRHQGLIVFQIQLAKQVDALPLTRDYMQPQYDAEPKRQSVAVPGRRSAA